MIKVMHLLLCAALVYGSLGSVLPSTADAKPIHITSPSNAVFAAR